MGNFIACFAWYIVMLCWAQVENLRHANLNWYQNNHSSDFIILLKIDFLLDCFISKKFFFFLLFWGKKNLNKMCFFEWNEFTIFCFWGAAIHCSWSRILKVFWNLKNWVFTYPHLYTFWLRPTFPANNHLDLQQRCSILTIFW